MLLSQGPNISSASVWMGVSAQAATICMALTNVLPLPSWSATCDSQVALRGWLDPARLFIQTLKGFSLLSHFLYICIYHFFSHSDLKSEL